MLLKNDVDCINRAIAKMKAGEMDQADLGAGMLIRRTPSRDTGKPVHMIHLTIELEDEED